MIGGGIGQTRRHPSTPNLRRIDAVRSIRAPRLLTVAVMVAALLTASCAEPVTGRRTGTTDPPTVVDMPLTTTTEPASTTTPSAPETPEESVAISFVTADGITLEGRRFGTGADFVVVAHMRPAEMDSWFDLAATLVAEGYSVLAFNFRGYGKSEGSGYSVDIDTLAAIDHAFELGAERVFLIGASMGGTGVIAAAAQREIAGIVTLSAAEEFDGVDALTAAATLEVPMLLFAEENKTYPEDAKAIAAASRGSAEVVVLPGDQHGTNLFAEHDPALTDRIVAFLHDHS